MKNVTVYSVHNKNYFRLRDVAMLINFSVGWDASAREIKLNLSEGYHSPADQMDEMLEKIAAISIEQKIVVNGDSVTLSGYNINGYYYFSIEDLAKIADFDYKWNDNNNKISLNKDYCEGIELEEINNLNEMVKEYLDENQKQKIIEENDVRYVAKSKDFKEIEKYIVNNINPNFNLDDFINEEYSPIGDVVIDTTNVENNVIRLPINMLELAFYMVMQN